MLLNPVESKATIFDNHVVSVHETGALGHILIQNSFYEIYRSQYREISKFHTNHVGIIEVENNDIFEFSYGYYDYAYSMYLYIYENEVLLTRNTGKQEISDWVSDQENELHNRNLESTISLREWIELNLIFETWLKYCWYLTEGYEMTESNHIYLSEILFDMENVWGIEIVPNIEGEIVINYLFNGS